MKKRQVIGLFLPTRTKLEREIIKGIRQHSANSRDWVFVMPMIGPRSWGIGSLDGAIMWCGHDGFSSAPAVGLGKAPPTVLIKQPMSDASAHPGVSVSGRLTFDPLEIGRMTGHSYLGRGFVSFGFLV